MEVITIRPARPADVPLASQMLADLASDLGYPSTAATDEDALMRYGFGERPLFQILIAEGRGGPLGLALFFPEFSSYRRRPGVYLQDLYLMPEARGTGLGRQLIGAVLREAAAWQAVYLRLAVNLDNDNALGFYARLGFQTDPNEQSQWIEGATYEDLAGNS